jgi:RHS repeat-associated core domain
MKIWMQGIVFGIYIVGLSAGVAHAEEEQVNIKPLNVTPDVNQVDLLSGRFFPELPKLEIPAAPRLTFHTLQQFDSKVIGTLYSTNTQREESFSLTFGGKTSEYFKCVSTDCQPQQNTGSTFTGRVGQSLFRYTQGQTGIKVAYSSLSSYFDYSGDPFATISAQSTYYATSITYPDGEVITITYDKATLSQVTYHRPSRVTSNVGYELVLSYFSNDINTGASGWGKLKHAYIAKSSAPSVALAEADYSETGKFTDLGGQLWQFTGFSNALGANDFAKNFTLKTPQDVQNNVTVTSATRSYAGISHNNFVSSVTRNGQTYQYNYTVATGTGYEPREQFTKLVITGPESYLRTLEYYVWGGLNKRQLVKSDTDALGNKTQYTYTLNSRIDTVTFPEGNKIKFSYDHHANITEKRQIAKPGSGLADKVETAVYPTTCYAIACFRPIYTVDAQGNRTDYTFSDEHGGLLTKTEPADLNGQRRFTSNTYTQINGIYRLTKQTACVVGQCGGTQAQVTLYTYWENTGLIKTKTITNAAGSPTQQFTYHYDNAGRVVIEDGPLTGTDDATYYSYDASGRLVWQTGAKNAAGYFAAKRQSYPSATRRYQLTETGTVTSRSSTSLTLDVATKEVLNSVNQVIRKELSAPTTISRLWQYSYDGRGRLTCEAVRMNSAVFTQLPSSACTLGAEGTQGPDRITRTDYDRNSQVVRTVSGLGSAVESTEREMTYAPNGTVLSESDGKGNTTSYSYDGYDRLSQITYPNSTYELKTYDSNDNLLTHRKRDGVILRYTYDAKGQTKSLVIPNESTIYYNYDGLGRETEVVRGTQITSYSYDGLSRLAQLTTNGRTLSYQYNAASQRTRLTFPDGFYVTYHYDNAGNLTEIRQQGTTTILANAYDRIGRVKSVSRAGGASSAISYDRMNRLTQYTHSGVTTINYTYNPASQLAQRSVTNVNHQIQVPTLATESYTSNNLNQYTRVSAGGVSKTINHSTAGNLTGFDGWSYQYDNQNRLKQASKSGTTVTLTYDATGQLNSTTHNGSKLTYLYDGDELVAEYNSSGTLLRRYIHGIGVDDPLIRYDGTGTSSRRYLHSDERGTIIAETTSTGGILTSHKYGPYGEPINGSTSRFRYTGQTLIPGTLLYYYKARVYHPKLGRFLQTDPVGYEDGMNWYAYVGNDPINMKDPSGMYGRGSGWSDKAWKKFDAAQKQVASDMSRSANAMREEAAGLEDGATSADGYSASELNSMADNLDAGAAALNDDGSDGYVADAVSTNDIGRNFGSAVSGGKTIKVATDHTAFGNNQMTQWMAGHESLHSAGLSHPKYMGFVPYRFGNFGQRMSFKRLPRGKRHTNPDHVMSRVYP